MWASLLSGAWPINKLTTWIFSNYIVTMSTDHHPHLCLYHTSSTWTTFIAAPSSRQFDWYNWCQGHRVPVMRFSTIDFHKAFPAKMISHCHESLLGTTNPALWLFYQQTLYPVIPLLPSADPLPHGVGQKTNVFAPKDSVPVTIQKYTVNMYTKLPVDASIHKRTHVFFMNKAVLDQIKKKIPMQMCIDHLGIQLGCVPFI